MLDRFWHHRPPLSLSPFPFSVSLPDFFLRASSSFSIFLFNIAEVWAEGTIIQTHGHRSGHAGRSGWERCLGLAYVHHSDELLRSHLNSIMYGQEYRENDYPDLSQVKKADFLLFHTKMNFAWRPSLKAVFSTFVFEKERRLSINEWSLAVDIESGDGSSIITGNEQKTKTRHKKNSKVLCFKEIEVEISRSKTRTYDSTRLALFQSKVLCHARVRKTTPA